MPAMSDILQLRIPIWKAAIGVVLAIVIQHAFNKPQTLKSSAEGASAVEKEGATKDAIAVKPEEGKDESEDGSDSDDDSYEDPYDYDDLFYDGKYTIRDDYQRSQRPFKMLLCVNMELKMGHGKVAAQCGHATMGAYQLSRKHCKSGLRLWEQFGVAKIALKVPKESDMYELYEKAKAQGLVAFIVQDAGHTQIPAGSRTVLAVGPAPAEVLDPIFSHLKLL